MAFGLQVHIPGPCCASCHQHPQVLPFRAALNPFTPQSVLIVGVPQIQVCNFALAPVEFHEIYLIPVLKPVSVTLGGIPPPTCVNWTIQFSVIHRLSSDALNPTLGVIREDTEQKWYQCGPQRSTTCHQSLFRHWAVACKYLDKEIQIILYL